MIELYFKMIISLIFVLVILGLFYLVIKKRLNMNNTGSLFKILEYKSFGPKSGVMALKFGEKILLLAITPTNITMIEQFDAKDVLNNEQSNNNNIAEKIKKLRESLNESN